MMTRHKRNLILEGARDRALEQFIPLYNKRGIDANVSYVKQTLMKKFVVEANIHSLSLAGNYYLVGVARYYFNGDLTTNKRLGALYNNVTDHFKTDVCERLDALINILRDAYIDSVGTKFEQPEDFGTLTIDKLLRKYNKKINKALGLDTPKETQEEQPKLPTDHSAGNGYTYDIMYSYEDCKKYNQATSPGAWCITYGQQHYNAYIRKFAKYGGIHYVIFRKDGYENVPRKMGPGFTNKKPHDEYGNSLICVLQRNDCPEPTYITSRWNHGYNFSVEADHAYTKREFLNVIGADDSVLRRAYDEWRQNYEGELAAEKERKADTRAQDRAQKLSVLRAFKYLQMLINGGANPFAAKLPNGFTMSVRPLGWSSREWCEKMGTESLTIENAPQKYPYTLTMGNEDRTFSYTTVMDRKQILFDQTLDEDLRLRSMNESMFGITDDKGYMHIYDRKRHTFLDIDGVKKFKYYSPSDLSGYMGEAEKLKDKKYALLAVSGNQAALLNLKTLKPVRTRNGAVWFEDIHDACSWNHSMRGSRGEISLAYDPDNTLLRMMYDSASGEEYMFNTATDTFVNIPEGMSGEWHITGCKSPFSKLYPRTVTISKGYNAENPWNTDRRKLENVYMNADDGSIFTINGISVFKEVSIEDNVAAYMTVGSDIVNYYDLKLNRPITFNGQPLTTRFGTDTIDEMSGYIKISLSRYIESTENRDRYTYGHSYTKNLLYNPNTGTFYHDDISGYVFKIYYGSSDRGITAYVPEGKSDQAERSAECSRTRDGALLYQIPPLAKNTNEERKLGQIIRESIYLELGIKI